MPGEENLYRKFVEYLAAYRKTRVILAGGLNIIDLFLVPVLVPHGIPLPRNDPPLINLFT